jgi:glutamate synthase domain-containing protein 1
MSDKSVAEIKPVETNEHAEMYQISNQIGRSVIAVIDTMTQRGAFKGEELSTIGGLRDQCIRMIQLVEIYHSKN